MVPGHFTRGGTLPSACSDQFACGRSAPGGLVEGPGQIADAQDHPEVSSSGWLAPPRGQKDRTDRVAKKP